MLCQSFGSLLLDFLATSPPRYVGVLSLRGESIVVAELKLELELLLSDHVVSFHQGVFVDAIVLLILYISHDALHLVLERWLELVNSRRLVSSFALGIALEDALLLLDHIWQLEVVALFVHLAFDVLLAVPQFVLEVLPHQLNAVLGFKVLELDWNLQELLLQFGAEWSLFLLLVLIEIPKIAIQFVVFDVTQHLLLEQQQIQILILVDHLQLQLLDRHLDRVLNFYSLLAIHHVSPHDSCRFLFLVHGGLCCVVAVEVVAVLLIRRASQKHEERLFYQLWLLAFLLLLG